MTDDGLTADESRTLESLLDVLVPPSEDGRLPGAGALDLGEHVARTLRRMPVLRPVLEYGLSALAALAAERRAGGLAAMTLAERTEVMRDFAASDQFLLPALLFLVYSGYYAQPQVAAALGFEARPPHPEGYAMPANDLAILEPVRRRRGMYRE